MSKPLIVIPARMASKRFPGKPLAEISGVSMIRRTAHIAEKLVSTDYVIATDHEDIAAHCREFKLPVVITEPDLPSGSDRALAAANIFNPEADIVLNLQGDAPFTDPSHIQAILDCLSEEVVDIATPAIRLTWDALDDLRESKTTTPFSGTTVIEKAGRAVWFSKAIIPSIRKEASLRELGPLSPVLRHIGLYGFRRAALERFTELPQSHFEKLEGLEQLRALENGMSIGVERVSPPQISSPGIDTKEDLKRAELLIQTYGDPFTS
ncbi:MAG: 3-deoxy-manno-octulosonate cytidylyltransferase [Litorimonas sp.]